MGQPAEAIDLTDPDETERVVDELKAHFARITFWKYERFLGDGEYAVAVLVKERNPFVPGRRMVVKRAKGLRGETSLRRETDWLTKLRGSEHIVGLLAARDNTDSVRVLSNFLRVLKDARYIFQSPASLAFRGTIGPIVGIEYLENGTLGMLIKRLQDRGMHLPNRVLWSFFLCMVRACVALAYPPKGAPGGDTQLENIPTDGRQPIELTHGDLHSANIMIGRVNPRFPEHSIVPVAKFIDLGEAKLDSDLGITENLYKVSLRIFILIIRHEFKIRRARSMYRGFETLATEILPHGDGAKYPTLDPELREFLARCLATDEALRPGLQEMLQTTHDAFHNKTASDYAPNEALESDDAMKSVIKTLLYDADSSASIEQEALKRGVPVERESPDSGIFAAIRVPKRRR
ncbi:putative Protein kinase domain-containing protein [Seiridium unicorne]|uniref:non-specific serine/threonine protein kinase n=1 Tax=Seiridium unicorne TaxID=138068 RepID=A0ABR2UML3_9PEZI